MSPRLDNLVLPRPKAPIPGPAEAIFTKVFGRLLPPAKYLNTVNGRAAYYEVLPSHHSAPGDLDELHSFSSLSLAPGDSSHTPDRVLFIHGVQTPALGMLPLARALHAKFPGAHLVLVDLWGHGLSDTPVLPHDPNLFHQLLDALLDRLEWPSAHLVGYSFGGALTVGYVVSRSKRVQSFTLVAPAGLIRSSKFTAEEQGHLRGDDEAAAREWVLEFLEGGDLVVPADWRERVGRGEIVAEAVRDWQMREHSGHAATVVAVFRDGGVMDKDAEFVRAARTGIPSLVVLGAKDDLCSEEELKELGFANVAVVPEVGHGVVRERAPQVAAFISDFWMGLNKSNSG
ncbi:alpha/beta-hydrolase [Cucurbitaria berberidis CBS 394.84]|uniref:Alpha/beta-hydrolase n=1 Tax=Cucurbitaria berberidis CBS 394.84 TaxID=1168544 RepID=A0A9P4LA39_9PLEO|nr:alpha/beta-hydrolase [Cucurbitaria berberidis CBS 394.84]KAF1847685.1 alpha/beta-hydrolase [Cucurbitaria berberidis CBS 394.84]